jgi:hypothetical protein
MQQSPDLGFSIALHILQRYKWWEEPLGINKDSVALQWGQVIVEDKWTFTLTI